MKKSFLLQIFVVLFINLFFISTVKSQTSITYNLFKNTFKADTAGGKTWGPDLIQDGAGGFVVDTIPAIFPHVAKSFGFNEGTGLKFDNVSAGNFLAKSFSVEVYYKYVANSGYRRLMEFHNYVGADTGLYEYSNSYNYYPLPNTNTASSFTLDNVYDHLVFTRDNSTTLIKAYHNGKEVLSTFDANESATIKNGNYLELFKDDSGENSAGNVAFVVLYNYTLSPQQILGRFNSFTSLGIDDISDLEMKIYPNPTATILKIVAKDFSNGFNATITDVTGKVVKEIKVLESNKMISVEDLQSGLYTLQITDGAHTVVKKFIKE